LIKYHEDAKAIISSDTMLYALKILTKKLIKQPQNLKSKHILIKVTNRKLINIH